MKSSERSGQRKIWSITRLMGDCCVWTFSFFSRIEWLEHVRRFFTQDTHASKWRFELKSTKIRQKPTATFEALCKIVEHNENACNSWAIREVALMWWRVGCIKNKIFLVTGDPENTKNARNYSIRKSTTGMKEMRIKVRKIGQELIVSNKFFFP